WVHSTFEKAALQKVDDLASTSATPDAKEVWNRRVQLRKPILQRDEVLSPKVYYAPEWELDKKPNKDAGYPDPLKGYGMTPEKWEYYNKVVWPPHYIVPETGLPKAREVFHCRESVHFSPKRMWQACQLIWRTNVDEAITQLNFQQIKSCKILAEVLTEAKERAVNEFHIEFPSDMFVADAFPIQCQIVKGARRHAHENWCTIRYRYINIFVRLEEGSPRNSKSGKRGKMAGSRWKPIISTLGHEQKSTAFDKKKKIELDETHLFIDREIVKILEEKLDQLMEQMNPELSDK
ncbi:REX1 DNA Repair, partial [Cooperia oncophora]